MPENGVFFVFHFDNVYGKEAVTIDCRNGTFFPFQVDQVRYASASDPCRREEDVPESLFSRSPRQASGNRERGTVKAHFHGAQRRLVRFRQGVILIPKYIRI